MNKLALHAKKCPNWAFYGVLGEFCIGCGGGGGVLGEFCTGCGVVGACWASFVPGVVVEEGVLDGY